MGHPRPFRLKDSFRRAFEMELAPGETTVAFTEMFFNEVLRSGATQRQWRMLVLTDRNLRIIQYGQKGVVRKRAVPVVRSSFTIPVYQITGLGVSRAGRSGSGGEFASMRLTWSGGREEYFSDLDNANDFISACHDAFENSTSIHQTKLVSDAVVHLSELLADGLIDREEFERAKAGFVGTSPSTAAEMVTLLRQLHGLMSAGVLTEGEFNMKKWEILSRR